MPTFRGSGGLWKTFRAEDLATPAAFEANPALVWEWYAWRRSHVAGCQPNAAHRALVEMETTFPGAFTLVTQNVDGLHEKAGSIDPLCLHGSIWKVRCRVCPYQMEDPAAPIGTLPPRCPRCRDLLRPGVVWFGESLPAAVLRRALEAAETAATCLVIGTSALVHPAASIPLITVRSGGRIVEINPEETPISAVASARLIGPAAEQLPAWWQRQRAWLAAAGDLTP